jgi:hypothetical protein
VERVNYYLVYLLVDFHKKEVILKETNYLRQTIRLVLNLCRNFIRIQLIFSIDSVVYFLELPIGYNTSSTVAIILINYLSKEIN